MGPIRTIEWNFFQTNLDFRDDLYIYIGNNASRKFWFHKLFSQVDIYQRQWCWWLERSGNVIKDKAISSYIYYRNHKYGRMFAFFNGSIIALHRANCCTKHLLFSSDFLLFDMKCRAQTQHKDLRTQ